MAEQDGKVQRGYGKEKSTVSFGGEELSLTRRLRHVFIELPGGTDEIGASQVRKGFLQIIG
jgi:hypothetical protein